MNLSTVMPGLVPGIHVFRAAVKTWMAGTSPAMTTGSSASRDATLRSRDIRLVGGNVGGATGFSTLVSRRACLAIVGSREELDPTYGLACVASG